MLNRKVIEGKEYVFCEWRRKFVRFTPEEYVRQTFLHYLIEQVQYPKHLIAVEVPLTNKRADAVVYSKTMQPLMLVEFKADSVELTQKTLDQAAIYNRQLHVPYLILHNGRSTIIGRIDENKITFAEQIPAYGDLA